MAGGDCANHWSNVSALCLLYDYRSQNNSEIKNRTVPGGFLCCSCRDAATTKPGDIRTALCPLHRWPDGSVDRNLARVAPPTANERRHCMSLSEQDVF